MLNMAPDKAADETISFQCYHPLSAALLYTGRPALIAALSLPLSQYPSVLVPQFLPLRCIGPSFYFLLLSSPPPFPPLAKIYLSRRWGIFSLLSSFYHRELCLSHRWCIFFLSLIFFVMLLAFSRDIPCTSNLGYAIKIETVRSLFLSLPFFFSSSSSSASSSSVFFFFFFYFLDIAIFIPDAF